MGPRLSPSHAAVYRLHYNIVEDAPVHFWPISACDHSGSKIPQPWPLSSGCRKCTGLILGFRPANERRHYKVTPSGHKPRICADISHHSCLPACRPAGIRIHNIITILHAIVWKIQTYGIFVRYILLSVCLRCSPLSLFFFIMRTCVPEEYIKVRNK